MTERLALLFALAASLPAQPGFDFKSLDRLGANAKDTTSITLEGQTLKLAAGFLGGEKDAESLKSLVSNLKGIYVRSWEYDRGGMYSPADLAPFRSYVQARRWSKIIEVKEAGESSEVWIKTEDPNKADGIAVIDAEPRELTVVYIEGPISVSDLAKLSGNLDLPDLDVLKRGTAAGPKSNPNSKPKTGDRKTGDKEE